MSDYKVVRSRMIFVSDRAPFWGVDTVSPAHWTCSIVSRRQKAGVRQTGFAPLASIAIRCATVRRVSRVYSACSVADVSYAGLITRPRSGR